MEFLVDLGLINYSQKTDTKCVFTLERNMNKLFESNKKVTAIPDEPDALIQFHDHHYFSYQEINLTQNCAIYFDGILSSETALKMGLINSPYQQLFEVNTGIQAITVLFEGAQRQLEWIKISLIYYKSYQHQTIYDIYDVELASKFIQSVKFENTSSTYSLTGKLEYNQKNEDDKDWLFKMFIAYNCDGFSTAPLTQHKSNKIYKEITQQDKFATDNTDERLYIDMRRSQRYTEELEKLTRDDSGVTLTVNLS